MKLKNSYRTGSQNRLYRKMISAGIALQIAMVNAAATESGGSIASSKIGQGVKSLFSDLSGMLLVLCPIAGGAAAVYFLIRRSAADEQDGKMWEKRAKVAIGCGVGGLLVSGIINLLMSYFK